jgi:lipooligosaccharide transport system permease protein
VSLLGASGAASRLARRSPPGARAHLLVERNARAFRHVWSTIVSGFFEPVFYLFSLGVGLGALVGRIDVGSGRTVSYAAFVAPALLAASAMNGAIYDSAHNIFWKLRYARLYDIVLASPLGVADVAVGEVTWALLRGSIYATGFLLVASMAGLVGSWWALLALPATLLIGLAFAGLGMATATLMRSWQDFDLLQLVMLPLFLFSATFYPLSTYPESWRWLVQVTPLYQGTALVRQLMLGTPGPGALGHALYLVVIGLLGMAVAGRRLKGMLLS